MPHDPAGRLFARGLDQIDELYLEPVSIRLVALGGAARLAQLDPKLHTTEVPGPHELTELELTYDGREVAAYPSPQTNDPHAWGEWLGRVEADAKQASPIVASRSQDDIDKALFDGIVGGLDRFSRYSTPQVARDQRAARDGFGGIGILLEDDTRPYRITKVMPGSPADAAAIRAGEDLVAVEGQATANRSQNDVIRELRGAVGSTVAVTVAAAGRGAPHQYWLQRTLIVLPTVTETRAGGVLIFHISGFNQNTTQQLVADLQQSQREMGTEPHGIILDLRGDPGGLLDQAVGLADVFIAKGPIVATTGRAPAARQYFEAAGDAVVPRVPLVVLINGGSASASEIVAAALQDAGRAVVVGTASYGKGTVQTVLRLPNDGELILTWAQLIAPAGYSLNGHGVVPTVCTIGLGGDAQSIAALLQRTTAPAAAQPNAATPRAALDERGWASLRQSCPPRPGDRAVDVAVAERLLEDPALYAQAMHMIGPAPNLAAKPAGTAPTVAERGLTGGDRTLSSSERP
jgi:carboxyl-terminal processing protease